MKKVVLSLVFALPVLLAFSQNKKIKKIERLYEKAKYEKCINVAKSYISENRTLAAPYYFASMSYFHEYKKYKDNFSVKSAGKYLAKGMTKEKHEVYDAKFKHEIDSLHLILKEFAANYFEANREKSKPYFEYLATIYKDTLKQYNCLFKEDAERPDAKIVRLTKEGKINQTDNKGLKQGRWTKVYANGNTAYEAFFKDNKPVGEMKRYHENGKLSVRLNYNDAGDTAKAVFYDEEGNLISEGSYIGKKKTGKWLYYRNKLKVKEEHYKNDSLDGAQIFYWDNGQAYDKRMFKNGVQIGVWEKFYKNGQIFLKAQFENGVMNGTMLRYYKSGKLEVKGQYKNDFKEGVWTFYGEHGEKDTITYVKGKDVNEDEKEKRESDEYKKNIEKGKHIADPEDYKNNPYEYPINQ